MERKSSRSAAVTLIIIGLLVAYPVSIGPVWGFCSYFDLRKHRRPPMDGRIFQDSTEHGVDEWIWAFYWPLAFIPEPLGDWRDQWISFWRCVAEDARVWSEAA